MTPKKKAACLTVHQCKHGQGLVGELEVAYHHSQRIWKERKDGARSGVSHEAGY
jgi:hypothetical protein